MVAVENGSIFIGHLVVSISFHHASQPDQLLVNVSTGCDDDDGVAGERVELVMMVVVVGSHKCLSATASAAVSLVAVCGSCYRNPFGRDSKSEEKRIHLITVNDVVHHAFN